MKSITELKKVTIGIRYKRNFKIRSQSGEIEDYIINSNDFININFNKVEENRNGFVLVDVDENTEELNYLLSVDIDNIVITSTKINYASIDNDLEDLFKKIKIILNKFDVRIIGRVGIVFDYTFNVENQNFIVSDFLDIKDPNTTEIRISKKIFTGSTPIDLKNYDKNYNNVIISLAKSKNTTFSIDFQSCLIPEITSINDVNFNKIYEDLFSFIDSKFKFLWQKEN